MVESHKRIHMKHQMSSAADQAIEYVINSIGKTVEITMPQFDSALFSLFVTRVLEDEGVVSFTDDRESGFATKRPEWTLFVTFGGTRFHAEVYKLIQGSGVATVVLRAP